MPVASYRLAVGTLTLLLGSVLVLWAVLTPGFRAPDEPQHFNSVLRLATGGGWPAPGEAFIADATLIATREAGFSRPDQPVSVRTASLLPRGTLEGFGLEFARIVPPPPEQRSVLDHTADLQDEVPPTVDQMSQHPPLYYLLAAGVVRAVGALDGRWDQQLLLLRLLNCLIATSAVPLLAATALRVSGSRVAALVSAAALIGLPQFAHVNSAVTNDALTTVIGLAVTYLAARALTGPRGPALAVATGTVLGLGLLTKGFLLAAVPMVTLAFLLPARDGAPFRRRMASTVLVGGVALALGGWWWVRNLLTYGSVQPTARTPSPVAGGDEAPTLLTFAGEAVRRLNLSYWGNFGWLEVPIPLGVAVPLGIAGGLLVLAALVASPPSRVAVAVLLTFPVSTLLVVLSGSWSRYVVTGLFPGLQGRYLFSTLASLLTAGALTATLVMTRRARSRAPYVPAATLVGAAGLGAFGVVTAFQAFYQPWDEPVRDGLLRWASWSPLSGVTIAALAAATGLLGIVAFWALIRTARDRDGLPSPPPVP